MTTPENIRRMAESEALIESVQTMEYLNEFPSLGERRDFRRFPPRYGDPHYHPNRLGRRSMESNQERLDNQTDNTRSTNRRDQRGSERRPAYGRGFMSPMRRVAEAAQHVPEAVYSDSETQNRSSQIVTTIPEEQQRDQSSILPQGEFQDMERGDSLQQQPNIASPTNIVDDWETVEPVIIPVSEPVLNGGPPMHNGTPTPIHMETPGREREEEISPSPQRENSLYTEDQRTETIQDSCEVISVLPSEDPHIPCSVCEVIDCMIHNPRHRYCMNCGHRLLGPHVCPNVDQDQRRPHTPQIPKGPLGITMSPEQVRRNVPHSMENDNIASMEDSEVESFRDTVRRGARMLNMDLIPRSTDVPPLIPSRRERSISSTGPPPYDTIMSDPGIEERIQHAREITGKDQYL